MPIITTQGATLPKFTKILQETKYAPSQKSRPL